ncbi:O-antigen translocase [Shewanella colwelliana]|uniref:O-antigen translocase n=1 Tax=Shewanella colwelliana TaxID=23 RepID=UPI003D08F329
MNLYKTSILSGISTLIGMISGFIITKVIAVYVGPSGMALIGQLQNFINLVMLSAGGFLKTALVKFTSEFSNDIEKRNSYWSASIVVISFFNLLSFVILFFYSSEISTLILKSDDFEFIFVIFSISLPLFILNTVLLSILNGLSEIRKFVILNIALNITSLFLVTMLSYLFKLNGALIAYVTNQSLVLLFSWLYLKNEPWFKFANFFSKSDRDAYKGLFGFALITIASVFSSNISMIYIRDFIINNLSLNDAGYWQGIWTLSQVVLSLVTVAFSTYLLPKLSALKEKNKISIELIASLKLMIPLTVFIAVMMYFLREIIIYILFTNDFISMSSLFLPQMLGNVVKVIGWVFGYVLVAKGMVKYTVSTEIFFAFTWFLLTKYFIAEFGLVGACYAYIVNSTLHAFSMLYLYVYKVK